MADDPKRRTGDSAVPLSAMRAPAPTRDPRTALVVPVRFRYHSILDFADAQSLNLSRSGMFLAPSDPLPVGTIIDFELALVDGLPLLKGQGEVVRVSANPKGIGVKFQQLDDASRALLDRIVQVNTVEGKRPTVPLDFESAGPIAAPAPATATPASQAAHSAARSGANAPAQGQRPTGSQAVQGGSGLRAGTVGGTGGVRFDDKSLTLQLNPITVAYFTNNPLLNIRLGGFVVPAKQDVPLGTLFAVTITNFNDEALFNGKGKVVAKHEMRLGIRLNDVDKETLGRLQIEVQRLAPAK
jgi:Tfp pilus assembly protein PilZ